MFYLSALERETGKSARDCIVQNGTISFLVNGENMSRIIGKNGQNIKKFTEKLGKKVQLFEYYTQAEKFIEKALPNGTVKSVEVQENGQEKTARISFVPSERISVNRNQPKMKALREFLDRDFGIKNIRL